MCKSWFSPWCTDFSTSEGCSSKELEIFLIFPTLLLFSCQSHTSWPRVCAKHVIPNWQVACLHNLQSLWQKWRTGPYKLRAGQNWVFDWQVDLSGGQSEMIVPIAKCSSIVFLHEQWPKSWLLNVSRGSYHPVLWQMGDIRSHYEGSLLTKQYHGLSQDSSDCLELQISNTSGLLQLSDT